MDDPVDCTNDKLFEPTIDMLVNDFDDEQTLEEEEKLADPAQDQNELDNLQREGELSIEELMRLYNCPPPMSSGQYDRMKPKKPRKKRKHISSSAPNNPESVAAVADLQAMGEDAAEPTEPKSARLSEEVPSVDTNTDSTKESRADLPEDGIDGEDADVGPIAPASESNTMDGGDEDLLTDGVDDDEDEEMDGPSELVQLLDDVGDDEEEEADYDYYPDETDLKKTILVGENHQADIPDTILPRKDSDDSGFVPDQLLWSPHSEKVDDGAVERFLSSFYKLRRHLNHPQDQQTTVTTEQLISGAVEVTAAGGSVVKDEENALRKLLEADYNVEVALQQVCNLMQTNGGVSSGGYCGTTPAVTWSEEECRNFELGIRLYGKNFTLIHTTKVPSRSVQEIVQFYYMWKKTERYDSFAAKQRMEKKRHSISNQNPGLTEYMDKFLEEQQPPMPRSLSPRHHQLQPLSMAHLVSNCSGSGVTGVGLAASGGLTGNVDFAGDEDEVDDVIGLDVSAVASVGLGLGVDGVLVDPVPISPLLGGSLESGNDSLLAVNHNLMIYADSKRHRTTAGRATPPVVACVGGGGGVIGVDPVDGAAVAAVTTTPAQTMDPSIEESSS